MPLDCRVEHGGGHDHVVLVYGVVVGRGESLEATLTSAIQRAAAQRLLGDNPTTSERSIGTLTTARPGRASRLPTDL
jgi:hypothetical protein